MTMNSWKSVESCACLPPLRMLNIGTGRIRAPTPPSQRYSGTSCEPAAAWAQASETPRIALAPSSPLLGVPSSRSRTSSIPAWSAASKPTIDGPIRSVTFATAVRTPLPP